MSVRIAALALALVRDGAAGLGRRIPRSCDQDDRAVCRRRRHRRAGAHRRAKPQQQMGPAGRGGKPAGRIRRDRHPGGDEGAARRLHAADGVDRRADGGFRRRRWRRPVRRQQGALADRDRGGAALSAGGAADPAGHLDRRPDPAGEREAGGADLRLVGRRRGLASVRAAVCQRNRNQRCCTFPTRAPVRR